MCTYRKWKKESAPREKNNIENMYIQIHVFDAIIRLTTYTKNNENAYFRICCVMKTDTVDFLS